MKPQLSIRSLKILALSTIVAAFLNSEVMTQPAPEKNSAVSAPVESLEQFIQVMDKSLKYVAPTDISMENEANKALVDLAILSEELQAKLKYSAPVEKDIFDSPEISLLADANMERIKYQAPSEDEITSDGSRTMTKMETRHRPMKVEVYNSYNDAWLMKAGYYKSNQTPAWAKLKSALSGKADKHYASEF